MLEGRHGQYHRSGLPVAKVETPNSPFKALWNFAFASPASGFYPSPIVHKSAFHEWRLQFDNNTRNMRSGEGCFGTIVRN